MLTLLGVLIVVIAPTAVVVGLFAWTSRRERLRRDTWARQVALTESVHERLGAVAAPVVRRRRGGWQVSIAVPFERPAMTQALVTIVLEAFAPCERDPRSLEIVLTRQIPPATQPRQSRGIRSESLSWT